MDNERKTTLPGLPPLPKSLSVATGNSATSSTTHSSIASPLNNLHCGVENELFMGASTSQSLLASSRNCHSQRHGSLSSTQESLSDRESIHSRASSTHSHSSHHTPTNNDSAASSCSTSTLDAQIAILRREMYGLRQLDLSLLSQLWALNESIQGFRVFLQEQEVLSPPSPSPTASDSNSLDSEQEDESFLAPPKLPQLIATTLPGGSTTSHASTSSASGTSGSSSAASSMGKYGGGVGPAPPAPQKTHPQLPRILQQRMRRAPPPPPPTRPKQPPPPTKAPVQQRHV